MKRQTETERVKLADQLEESRIVRAEDLAREMRRFRTEMRLLYLVAFVAIFVFN